MVHSPHVEGKPPKSVTSGQRPVKGPTNIPILAIKKIVSTRLEIRSLLQTIGAGLETGLVWTGMGLLTVAFSLAIMGCSLMLWAVDPRRTGAHWLASWWGRSVLACHPRCRIRVTGRQHIERGTPSILVANHQSLFDIMALFCLHRQFKWVAKDSLFRLPFVGWAMAMTGYIRLSRGRHGSIRETYQRAREWLASGMSVFFFPEGTRSRTGRLGAFHNGAFKLAMETGIPVVPIAITGTRDLLARGSWRLGRRAQIQIVVLPPLDPARYPHDGTVHFRDDVHRLIGETLQRLCPSPRAVE